MTNNVQQVFSGDLSKLEATYVKLEQLQLRQEERLAKLQAKSLEASNKSVDGVDKLTDAHLQMGDVAGRSISSMVTKMSGYMLALGSVSTLVAAINKGLEKQKQLGQEAIQSSIQMATIDAALGSNIDKIENLGPNAKKARQIMENIGISDVNHMAMGMSFSLAKSFGDPKRGFETLEDAAMLTRHTPFEMEATSSAMGMLRNSTKMSRGEIRNLVAGAGAAIPTGKLGEIAQFGVGTIPGALMTADVDKHGEAKLSRQHLALYGSLMAMGLSAEVAGTASGSIEGSLREAFTSDPELAKFDPGDIEGRYKMMRKTEGGDVKLKAIIDRSLESLGDDLKGKVSSKLAQEGFLSGKMDEQYANIYNTIDPGGNIFAEKTKFLDQGSPDIVRANIQRRSEAAQKIGLASDQGLANAGLLDTTLETMQKNYYKVNAANATIMEGGQDFELNSIAAMPGGYGGEFYQKKSLQFMRQLSGYRPRTDGHGKLLGGDEAIPLGEFGEGARGMIETNRKQLALMEQLVQLTKDLVDESRAKGNIAAAMDAMNALR